MGGGYRYEPNVNMIQGAEKALYGGASPTGSMDYFTGGEPTYTYKGKQIPKDTYDYFKSIGKTDELGVQAGAPSQYSQQRPQFTYAPGESAYQIPEMNVSYTPTEFTTPDYTGLKAGAQTAAQRGIQQAVEGSRESMAARGLGQGGAARMGQDFIAERGGRQMADISRQYDVMQQEADLARQKAQAGESQFAAQFGRALAQDQLQRSLAQYGLDKEMRGEKMGYYRQPYEDLLRMYGVTAPVAGGQRKTGFWDVLGGIGGALTGIGTGYKAFR